MGAPAWPDADADHEDLLAIQHRVAERAVFEDAGAPTPTAVERAVHGGRNSPVVVGVDQAFDGDDAVSAAVAMADGRVIERATAERETTIPYIPGLLSFREGPAVEAAIEALTVEPDLLLIDGSGRIHYRQAGLATHIGVAVETPAVGVAKALLCGRPRESLAGRRPAGVQIPIEADDEVTAPEGTIVGHAVQTRQFDSPRAINPVFVSPGHRVGHRRAARIGLAACDGYKLPEPIRLADHAAGRATE
ncbi:endonuclease V [Halococcoides cellulosivorans]|uniref:Endonuclease V n=1 Tax=Halococcoides cellulosivorans TaxID=1679096 RepID=A0A2R4WZ25_9EURY|nr:endonuclease V [Halococcoides cellulosivorans]AWB26791.1 endonuclease V [Halococcoides cellulosivorans]